MFLKGRYAVFAMLLFATFVFRLCYLNISFINSFSVSLAKVSVTSSYKRSAKPVNSTYPQYGEKVDVAPDEVSEESVENDTSENLVKNAKYPSLLLASLHFFKDLQANTSLRGLAESFQTKQLSRTYLSISVLRI